MLLIFVPALEKPTSGPRPNSMLDVCRLPELIEVLGNEHKGVRKEAAITLGKIGHDAKAAVPALTAITDEPIIGFHAKSALEKINGK